MNSDLKPALIFYQWSSVVRQTKDLPSGQREERDQGNILHTSVTPMTFLQFYTCAVYHSSWAAYGSKDCMSYSIKTWLLTKKHEWRTATRRCGPKQRPGQGGGWSGLAPGRRPRDSSCTYGYQRLTIQVTDPDGEELESDFFLTGCAHGLLLLHRQMLRWTSLVL